MDAKEFLEMGRGTARLIQAKRVYTETLQDEIRRIEWLAGDVPKYAMKERPIYQAIRLAHQMLEEVNTEIEALEIKQRDMIKVIEAVPDPLCQEVLTRRYIQDEDWPQIADEMFYSVRGIFRIGSRAIEMVEVPEKYKAI